MNAIAYSFVLSNNVSWFLFLILLRRFFTFALANLPSRNGREISLEQCVSSFMEFRVHDFYAFEYINARCRHFHTHTFVGVCISIDLRLILFYRDEVLLLHFRATIFVARSRVCMCHFPVCFVTRSPLRMPRLPIKLELPQRISFSVRIVHFIWLFPQMKRP